MSPVQRAVTGVLRMVGVSCLLFGVLFGGLAVYHFYGGKAGFPLGSVLGGAALFVAGTVILLKSSVLAARFTEDSEE